VPDFVIPCVTLNDYSHVSFLGAFATFRKTIISFVMPVRQSVSMEQLGYHRTDFDEICCLSFFVENL
jgi:hypothetical protein